MPEYKASATFANFSFMRFMPISSGQLGPKPANTRSPHYTASNIIDFISPSHNYSYIYFIYTIALQIACKTNCKSNKLNDGESISMYPPVQPSGVANELPVNK